MKWEGTGSPGTLRDISGGVPQDPALCQACDILIVNKLSSLKLYRFDSLAQ